MFCGSVGFGFSNCPILFIATFYIDTTMYECVLFGDVHSVHCIASLALSVHSPGFPHSEMGMECFDWFYVLIAYSECCVKRQIYCLVLCPSSTASLLRDQIQTNICFCTLSLICFEYTQFVFCSMDMSRNPKICSVKVKLI